MELNVIQLMKTSVGHSGQLGGGPITSESRPLLWLYRVEMEEKIMTNSKVGMKSIDLADNWLNLI